LVGVEGLQTTLPNLWPYKSNKNSNFFAKYQPRSN
jgi:hypothetical protein